MICERGSLARTVLSDCCICMHRDIFKTENRIYLSDLPAAFCSALT